jgi:hypothetical protein
MTAIRLTPLTLSTLLLYGGPARAEDYRDESRHYALTLPDDWTLMAPEWLAAINAFSREKVGIEYQAGFAVKDRPAGSTPYVLVQHLNKSLEGKTYDQIDRSLANEMSQGVKQVEGKFADVAKDLSVGQAALDRARNRIIIRGQMDVVDTGRIKSVSFGPLGEQGIVLVHCYALEPEFDSRLPTFNAIAESFRFDPGYEFVPSSGLLTGAGRDVLIGGIVGGVVGGSVVLYRLLARRRPAPPARGESDWSF